MGVGKGQASGREVRGKMAVNKGKWVRQEGAILRHVTDLEWNDNSNRITLLHPFPIRVSTLSYKLFLIYTGEFVVNNQF